MNSDQRSSLRHEFPYEQRVATWVGGATPKASDFRTVPCENVSCSGIAFYLENEPSAKEYVVALGTAPKETYLCARVVHVRSVRHNGQWRYRVGCEFTGRARLDCSDG